VRSKIEEELALRLGGGHPHQPPVAQDVFMNLGLDPVERKRHQSNATLGVEALDRFHEPDVAFLDEVGMRQTVTQILARDGHHQTQVRHHQFAGGLQIRVLAEAPGEF
jgi:hypothetical protein